jgi:hypothetical protein
MQRQILIMTLVSCLGGISPALAQEAPGAQELPMASAGASPEAFDARLAPEVLQARPPRPQPSSARMTGELVAGTLAGSLGITVGLMSGVAVFYLQDEPCTYDDYCDTDWGEVLYPLGGAFVGTVALYPLGNGLGVALAGRTGNQTGSIGAAIRGSYVGAVTGAAAGATLGLLASLFTSAEHRGSFTFFGGATGWLVGAPIGAFIGFDRTRAYDVSPARPPLAGLVSVDEDRAHLTVPVISMMPDPLHPGHVVTSVRLIDARY